MRLLRCPRMSRRQTCALGTVLVVALIFTFSWLEFPRLKLSELVSGGPKYPVRLCEGCNKVNRDLIILPRLELQGADNKTIKPSASKKLVVLITSSFRNKERRSAIRDTWASLKRVSLRDPAGDADDYAAFGDVEVQTLFVIGGGGLPATAISALQTEAREFGDLLVTPYSDSFANLTMQVLSAFQFLAGATQQFAAPKIDNQDSRYAQFSWLLKCDDDSYVNLLLLLRRLANLENEIDDREVAVIAGHVLSGIRALRLGKVSSSINDRSSSFESKQSEQMGQESLEKMDFQFRAAGKFGRQQALNVDKVDTAANQNAPSSEYRFGADEQYPSFASGSAYVINLAAFWRSVKLMPDVMPYRLDDVYVTGLLREAAANALDKDQQSPIRLVNLPEFLLIENKRFGLTPCDYAEWIMATHPVSADELRRIWITQRSPETMRKCGRSTSSVVTLTKYRVFLLICVLALIGFFASIRRVRYFPVKLLCVIWTRARSFAPKSATVS